MFPHYTSLFISVFLSLSFMKKHIYIFTKKLAGKLIFNTA